MLHHFSIAVKNPANVAKVLAEIVQGKAFPFPVFANSYMVMVGDQYGTAIEILPLSLELIPGEVEVSSQTTATPSHFTATHAAISVPISEGEIAAIATREGWIHRYCDRGPFDLIEFWIENHILFELLPPSMVNRYQDFMSMEKYLSFMESMAPA